jgi:hypothetical protein
MRTWGKAFVIASLVEVPLVVFLTTVPNDVLKSNPVVVAINWYHLPAAYLTFIALTMLNPGPGLKANVFQWCSTFALQVIMFTAPLVFLLLKGIERLRRKPDSKAQP